MYSITLQDAPADIPEKARQEAERRFQRTLERTLGGPDAVLAAYQAWAAAEDTTADEMKPEDVALAKKWIAAAGRARDDAFQQMGETEAWFEVRIEQ
ncbi:hypothetical protein [Castellaniella sp.]|uniref:hypothetical protein n=1 Tax=Castellaniella sp. TaxID=1955812 RepID=UPI002AFF8744|nr:hypothetical protein [Castellaniella sp.]